MKTRGLELDLGNLAWAPVNDFTSVEVLDRFNGIPTLGVFSSGSSSYLFWRTMHVGRASVWLYVSLTEDERVLLMSGKGDLNGILFQRTSPCYSTVGAAHDTRLVFEREIQLAVGQDSDQTWRAVIDHAVSSLGLALEHGLPPARRDKMLEVKRELQSV